MAALEVEVVEWPEALIVHIRGEAALGEAEWFERGLMRVTLRRPALAVLELSGLNFISSLAMGSIVAFAKGLALTGGRVTAAGARKPVREALMRARLNAMMPMFETVEEAVIAAAEDRQDSTEAAR